MHEATQFDKQKSLDVNADMVCEMMERNKRKKYLVLYYIGHYNIIVVVQNFIEQIFENDGTHVICGDFN